MKEKIVGILGGMGPEATVDFMQRVINLTPAKDDSDHIRMFLDNNPKVPSRIKAIIDGTGENPIPHLVKMAQQLEKQGADFLVIPCNTAHFYYENLIASVSIPILNMVECTVEAIIHDQPNIKKVGLLASTAALLTNIFKKALNKKNIEILYPSDDLQKKVLDAIKKIKAGNYGNEQITDVQNAADYLLEKGTEAIIIGCTELSVISRQVTYNVPLYDSSQVLAENVVKLIKETH